MFDAYYEPGIVFEWDDALEKKLECGHKMNTAHTDCAGCSGVFYGEKGTAEQV